MPSIKLKDLTSARKRWMEIPGDTYRSQQFGDYEIGFNSTPVPVDLTTTYQEGCMAGGVCQCPHYGYVFKGKIRCVYPGTENPDEIAETGDTYFFPAGHVLVYEEATDALELNPAYALQELMSGMNRAMIRRREAGIVNKAPGERDIDLVR